MGRAPVIYTDEKYAKDKASIRRLAIICAVLIPVFLVTLFFCTKKLGNTAYDYKPVTVTVKDVRYETSYSGVRRGLIQTRAVAEVELDGVTVPLEGVNNSDDGRLRNAFQNKEEITVYAYEGKLYIDPVFIRGTDPASRVALVCVGGVFFCVNALIFSGVFAITRKGWHDEYVKGQKIREAEHAAKFSKPPIKRVREKPAAKVVNADKAEATEAAVKEKEPIVSAETEGAADKAEGPVKQAKTGKSKAPAEAKKDKPTVINQTRGNDTGTEDKDYTIVKVGRKEIRCPKARLDDLTFIKAVRHLEMGPWHQYDILIDARPYGWESMIDWADYLVAADMRFVDQVTVTGMGGPETDFTEEYNEKKSLKSLACLKEESGTLGVAGSSCTIGGPVKIVWINQSRMLRIFIPLDNEDVISRYAETVIRRTFGTEDEMKLGKPQPEAGSRIMKPQPGT